MFGRAFMKILFIGVMVFFIGIPADFLTAKLGFESGSSGEMVIYLFLFIVFYLMVIKDPK